MALLERQEAAPAAGGGFDFTGHVRRLSTDMARRTPHLGHIDPDRVAIGFCQTRKPVSHGTYASLTPMRFVGGRVDTVRRRRRWTLQRLYDPSGREMLYILSLYLPRFMNLPFRQKLTTLMHELWHIGPRFDGDLRRYDGRCFVHTGSQRSYDVHAERLADDWLSLYPPHDVYDFLHASFQDLVRLHGGVYGTKIPTPKLVPVD
jgi:hypothetical protein